MSRILGIVIAVVGLLLIIGQLLHWFEGFFWAGLIALILGGLMFWAASRQ